MVKIQQTFKIEKQWVDIVDELHIPKSEVYRNAVKTMLKESDVIEIPETTEQWERRQEIKEKSKPMIARSNFRNNVWTQVVNDLGKDQPPTPEEFSERIDSYTEEAEIYNDGKAKERRDYVEWAKMVYTTCHPDGGPNKDVITHIIYYPESGRIPGKTETIRIAKDLILSKTAIPEQYFIDCWETASRLSRRDEWAEEWEKDRGLDSYA